MMVEFVEQEKKKIMCWHLIIVFLFLGLLLGYYLGYITNPLHCKVNDIEVKNCIDKYNRLVGELDSYNCQENNLTNIFIGGFE